jgi:hypothetical protein
MLFIDLWFMLRRCQGLTRPWADVCGETLALLQLVAEYFAFRLLTVMRHLTCIDLDRK